MQRCFNVLNQLAKHFSVTAIIHQDKNSFSKAAFSFPDIAAVTLYSTCGQVSTRDIFSLLPARFEVALRYRWYKRALKESSDSSFLRYYSILKKLMKGQKFDTVILENLSTVNAISIIRQFDKDVPIVYDAHNVDSHLLVTANKGSMQSQVSAIAIKKREAALYKNVDAVICCSEKDKVALQQLNRNRLAVSVIPNGVNIHIKSSVNQSNATKQLLFCGSLDYAPNVDGIKWFCESVWPILKEELPSLKLVVVGSGEVPQRISHLQLQKDIVFTGRVKELAPWYHQSHLSIAPLLTGSGTRLKILEAMGFGVAVVSTAKGAEGIEYTDRKNICIADTAMQFSNSVLVLLDDNETRKEMAAAAEDLVANYYDWNVIGITLKQTIISTIESGVKD